MKVFSLVRRLITPFKLSISRLFLVSPKRFFFGILARLSSAFTTLLVVALPVKIFGPSEYGYLILLQTLFSIITEPALSLQTELLLARHSLQPKISNTRRTSLFAPFIGSLVIHCSIFCALLLTGFVKGKYIYAFVFLSCATGSYLRLIAQYCRYYSISSLASTDFVTSTAPSVMTLLILSSSFAFSLPLTIQLYSCLLVLANLAIIYFTLYIARLDLLRHFSIHSISFFLFLKHSSFRRRYFKGGLFPSALFISTIVNLLSNRLPILLLNQFNPLLSNISLYRILQQLKFFVLIPFHAYLAYVLPRSVLSNGTHRLAKILLSSVFLSLLSSSVVALCISVLALPSVNRLVPFSYAFDHIAPYIIILSGVVLCSTILASLRSGLLLNNTHSILVCADTLRLLSLVIFCSLSFSDQSLTISDIMISDIGSSSLSSLFILISSFAPLAKTNIQLAESPFSHGD